MNERFLMLLIFFNVVAGCENYTKVDQSKIKADNLLKKIALGNAHDAFSEKYFDVNQTHALMNELKYKCDFPNRKGGFINNYLQETSKGTKVTFIYEFYLKCDNIRFIITYKLGKEIELFEFNLEPIEKDNSMKKKQRDN